MNDAANSEATTENGDESNEIDITERSKSSVLVVEADPNFRSTMRQALKTLGYGGVSDVSTHSAGLDRIQERKVSHVIFDAKATNMPPIDFLRKVLEMESESVCIPASFEPNVDDVFDMLIIGARGYLVKPFTIETVDASIVAASNGEPIADIVKNAKDRNEALVAICMSSLDKAATIMRQSRQFETAKVEIPRALSHFRRCSELAKTFAKGGDEALIDAIEKFCLDRSKGPASRLGRLRKRLRTSPVKEEGEGESADEGEAPGEEASA